MGEDGYKVILSRRSIKDLERIVKYIATDNPETAERFGQRLIDEAENIGAHPLAGRIVPEFGDPAVRERIFRAYRIVYQLNHEHQVIIVSRFWHAARGTPRLPEAS